ncbi:MAG: hypothetical protein LBC51_07535 [Treponema sp.]|jgi:hypothetical protein|nr:hypothetical protein [Treponema sp.]
MEGGEIEELPHDIWQVEEEKEHGQVEKQEIRRVRELEWLEHQEAWEGLKTIGRF